MSGDGAMFEGGVRPDWGVAGDASTPLSRLGAAESFSARRDAGDRGGAAEDAVSGVPFDRAGVTAVAADYAWVMAPTRTAVAFVSGRPWIVLASFVAHAGALALLILLAPPPAPIAEPTETPVEIVREEPPDTKPPETKKPEEKKPADKTPTPPEQAKAEPPKPEPPKPEPPKPVAKAEPAKPPPPPRDEPKVAEAEAPRPSPAELAKQAEDAKALQAMREELAALEAQKADLKAQSDALAAQAAAEQQAAAQEQAARDRAAAASAAGGVDKAFGPLPPSFAAVALPSDAAEGEVAVTYQQQVFSQLAKAKKVGKHVASPGVAHVVFHIDAAGKLLDVTLDHPSGDAFLDGEAVAIVRRAAPFPPPPPGAQRVFSASMRFRIDE